jgi:AcrR family transcriptional regulator
LSGASTLVAHAQGGIDQRQEKFWNDDTVGQICAAAVQVFYERGYHGATMRDIAERVGIRAPSIYNHFPTKEALLHHIMIRTMTRLIGGVEAALAASTRDPVARLSMFIREHIRFHLEYAHEAAVTDNELGALSDENRASVVALRDQYETMLRELLQEGLQQGAFAETEIGLASIAILTMSTTVSLWFRPHGPLSPQDVAAAYTRFALRMIGSVAVPEKND